MLIVAHAPLASALKAVAMHTFPDCARRLEAMDVPADMSPEDMTRQMRGMLLSLNDSEVLVLTDVFGATPCNVQNRLLGALVGTDALLVGEVVAHLAAKQDHRLWPDSPHDRHHHLLHVDRVDADDRAEERPTLLGGASQRSDVTGPSHQPTKSSGPGEHQGTPP